MIIKPHFRLGKPCLSLRSNRNQYLVSGQLKKIRALNLSPRYGHVIPCFDRCQLTITLLSDIKDVPCKLAPVAGVWLPCWVQVYKCIFSRHEMYAIGFQTPSRSKLGDLLFSPKFNRAAIELDSRSPKAIKLDKLSPLL